jgi:hypothetical protein
MNAPNPAIRVPTSVLGLEQNEHGAITVGSSLAALIEDPFPKIDPS